MGDSEEPVCVNCGMHPTKIQAMWIHRPAVDCVACGETIPAYTIPRIATCDKCNRAYPLRVPHINPDRRIELDRE